MFDPFTQRDRRLLLLRFSVQQIWRTTVPKGGAQPFTFAQVSRRLKLQADAGEHSDIVPDAPRQQLLHVHG